MKLLKIFSDRPFNSVRLSEHFNIVLAKIQDKTNKKDTHNLGKTSLIYVIDFLLLGEFNKKTPILSDNLLIEYTFYLEIKLNSGKFLIIRRNINSPTKISFKLNELELSNFTPPTEWDEENMAFEKAKEKLNEYLGFEVLTNFSYRKSITYFLRTQQDYSDVYQLKKFSKGKDKAWKPFVFELLGYNGDLIAQKLDLEQEAKDLKDKIKILEKEANVNVEEKDKLLGFIEIKQQERKDAEQTIDRFNFFLKDNAITKEIIEDLDFKIQTFIDDNFSSTNRDLTSIYKVCPKS